MASGWWSLQASEKTSAVNSVVDAWPCEVRFVRHVQLNGVRLRPIKETLESRVSHPVPMP